MATIIEGTSKPTCPYCEHALDDWWELRGLTDQNDGRSSAECDGCGKTYFIEAEYEVTFRTAKDEDDL